VKKQIERDIQRQVQTMLGTLMGQNKVMVSVTADIDFTQENREENLVLPVDEENMEGIAVSAQKLSETYSGDNAAAEGVVQAEEDADTTTYNTDTATGSGGESEKTEDTINYEVNRIKKQIVESPYKVRDLGIQVMVEPPDANDTTSLSQESIDQINNILGTIVRTSIDKTSVDGEISDEDLQNKIAVSVQKFNGKTEADTQNASSTIPWWIYVVGGVLLAIIALLIFLFIRTRKKQVPAEEEMEEIIQPITIPDVNEEKESEGTLRRKQLEKMAKEKPEDFAKLLRTWITED